MYTYKRMLKQHRVFSPGNGDWLDWCTANLDTTIRLLPDVGENTPLKQPNPR